MKKGELKHDYLLSLYSRVDEFLTSEINSKNELPDIIVSFCIAVEKILKIKLYNKNPILVFDSSCVKNDIEISKIAIEDDEDNKTIKIQSVINRFEIVFKEIFTSDELQALKDIYDIRNCFVHGYKPDDKITFDSEDVAKKMGTIWEKISVIAISLLGSEKIKESRPKKKYSEEELEEVLIEEVRKKIKLRDGSYTLFRMSDFACDDAQALINTYPDYSDSSIKRCPRCLSHIFSFEKTHGDYGSYVFRVADLSQYGGVSGLYKCGKCGLELTKKEYEIAKSIISRA